MSAPALVPSRPPPARVLDRLMLGLARRVPSRLAHHALGLLQRYPSIADAWGYHVREIHYYDALPDFGRIIAAETTRRRTFPAIPLDLPAQAALLHRLGRLYRDELAALRGIFDFGNPFFLGLDACLHYALVREVKPSRSSRSEAATRPRWRTTRSSETGRPGAPDVSHASSRTRSGG